MNVNVCKLRDDAIVPVYGTEGAACFDLHTVDGGTVEPLGAHTFGTGLSFEIPEGHVMLVFSRSGHGFKNGLRLSNCVGVIDADYRGEVKVRIHNDTPIAFGFEPGDRVAQAMVIPAQKVKLTTVTQLSNTERGAGGFGSTGS